jgi:hypothetical protein
MQATSLKSYLLTNWTGSLVSWRHRETDRQTDNQLAQNRVTLGDSSMPETEISREHAAARPPFLLQRDVWRRKVRMKWGGEGGWGRGEGGTAWPGPGAWLPATLSRHGPWPMGGRGCLNGKLVYHHTLWGMTREWVARRDLGMWRTTFASQEQIVNLSNVRCKKATESL